MRFCFQFFYYTLRIGISESYGHFSLGFYGAAIQAPSSRIPMGTAYKFPFLSFLINHMFLLLIYFMYWALHRISTGQSVLLLKISLKSYSSEHKTLVQSLASPKPTNKTRILPSWCNHLTVKAYENSQIVKETITTSPEVVHIPSVIKTQTAHWFNIFVFFFLVFFIFAFSTTFPTLFT